MGKSAEIRRVSLPKLCCNGRCCCCCCGCDEPTFETTRHEKSQPLGTYRTATSGCTYYCCCCQEGLTNAIFLSPSRPSSEKDPLRFSKSLSFSAEAGMLEVCFEQEMRRSLLVAVLSAPIFKIWGKRSFRQHRPHHIASQATHTHTQAHARERARTPHTDNATASSGPSQKRAPRNNYAGRGPVAFPREVKQRLTKGTQSKRFVQQTADRQLDPSSKGQRNTERARLPPRVSRPQEEYLVGRDVGLAVL